jgi:hypothetical protein
MQFSLDGKDTIDIDTACLVGANLLTTETGTPEPCKKDPKGVFYFAVTTETGTPEPCLTTETGTPEPLEQSASLLSQVSPTAIMADCLFPTGRTNK